jgi:hypothetical protein
MEDEITIPISIASLNIPSKKQVPSVSYGDGGVFFTLPTPKPDIITRLQRLNRNFT